MGLWFRKKTQESTKRCTQAEPGSPYCSSEGRPGGEHQGRTRLWKCQKDHDKLFCFCKCRAFGVHSLCCSPRPALNCFIEQSWTIRNRLAVKYQWCALCCIIFPLKPQNCSLWWSELWFVCWKKSFSWKVEFAQTKFPEEFVHEVLKPTGEMAKPSGKTARFILVVLYFLVLSVAALHGKMKMRPKTDQEGFQGHLVNKLLQNYSKRDPPMLDRPTEVRLGIYVNKISIDEQRMEMKLDMYLRQAWKDPRLKFDPLQAGKVTKIKLHADRAQEIWLPDTFFRFNCCFDICWAKDNKSQMSGLKPTMF